mgnify:CR=1 FL=1
MDRQWAGVRVGVVAALLAVPAAAFAQTAAREGTAMTVSFTATVKTSGRFVDGRDATTTSAVNRVLKGKCRLEAGAVGPYGLEGPSKQQEKALKKKDPAMAVTELALRW